MRWIAKGDPVRNEVHRHVVRCVIALSTTHSLRRRIFAMKPDTAPRFLLRDRDRIFGASFVEQVNAFGTRQVLATPRSPGQRAYVERVIGTIRRECLDYVIVFDERDLRHWLRVFIAHYHQTRTHLALGKDAPEPRPMQSRDEGRVVSISEVGGLHHRYQRPAA